MYGERVPEVLAAPGLGELSAGVGAELQSLWHQVLSVFCALLAVPGAGILSVLVTAVWKGWRGQEVVIHRGEMTFRLPRLRRGRKPAVG